MDIGAPGGSKPPKALHPTSHHEPNMPPISFLPPASGPTLLNRLEKDTAVANGAKNIEVLIVSFKHVNIERLCP